MGVIESLTPEGVDAEGPERMRQDYEFSRNFLLEKCGQSLGDAIFEKNEEIYSCKRKHTTSTQRTQRTQPQ